MYMYICNIYINLHLNPLKKFTSSSRGIGFKDNLVTLCRRFVMMTISDSGPGWKKDLMLFSLVNILQNQFIIISYGINQDSLF